MVEIREESSEPLDPNGPSSSGAAAGDAPPAGASQNNQQQGGFMTLSQFVSANMMDCCLGATRLATIFFAICYVLPFMSPVHPESAYYKAFAAAAASNALRMQQRVGRVSFTREFLATLMLEDSCHYLFFCVLFLTNAPVSMALIPISLFAALHGANFLVKLLRMTSRGRSAIAERLAAPLAQHTPNCLGVIACTEIFLVPILISMIFVGRASLFMPFVYYRFFTMRYASRRNPYTRQAMYQMRCSLDQVAASPKCPAIAAQLIRRSIGFISGLAPAY